ncbi:hypothetical protein ACFXHA_32790 [Nocardia sp. NPDC059240]|uniref:hypothetical protein n=1 Tax=Nocardia sp. NPDC059240 TaxID=3346786 RepID=UPI00368B6215
MSESPWPSALLQHGLALLEEGAPADALPALRAALAECEAGDRTDDPDLTEHTAECLYWIGAVHGTEEDFDTATAAYRRAADLLADAPLAELPTVCAEMAGRGLVLLERPMEALPYLRRAALGLERFAETEEQAEFGELFGDALAALERYDEAVIALRLAADRYLAVDRILDAADCRESCGDVAIEQDDAERVRDEHLAARELFERAGESESVARCSFVIARASKELGDTATAEREFLRARAEATAEGGGPRVANCDEELAELYVADGRAAEGSAALSAAAAVYSAAGDFENAASSRWQAGHLLLGAGRHDAGIAACTVAAEELLQAGHPELSARSWLAIGVVLQNCSRVPEARAAYARARDYYASHAMSLETAECDLELATILISEDRHAAAEALLRTVTVVFEEHREDPRYSRCLLYSAVLQGLRGRVTQARALLLEARRAASAAGSDDQVRACLIEEIRLIVNSGGDLPAAYPMLEEARRSAEQGQEWAIAAQCVEFTGLCQLLQDRYAEAETTLTQARAAYRLLGLTVQAAQIDLHLGRLYSLTGRIAEAEAAVAGGSAVLEEVFGADRYLAIAENMIGSVHLKAGRYPLAAAAFRTAEAALERSGLPLQAAVARLNVGSAVMLQQDFTTGIALMTSAIDVLNAEPFYHLYRAMGLGNIGGTEIHLGRFEEANSHLNQARALYTELGMVVAVAKIDLLIATAASMPGGPRAWRAALERGVPAVVFIDAQRFGFEAAHTRISWGALHAVAQTALFDWAHQLGDTALLADLVETAINSGTHVPEQAPRATDESDLQVTLAALAASDADGTETAASQQLSASGLSGAAALISGAILPMRPPPRLLMPDGHVALADHLAAADARYQPIARPGEVRVW